LSSDGISTDTALDAQYQFISDNNIFSAQTTYIYESQKLNATLPSDPSQTLKSFRLGGSYFYQRKYGGSVAYFSTTGSANATYAAASANSSPNTQGWALELDYLPWQNIKLAMQYTLYTKFDGASSGRWPC
jgi:hypothetical protein